MDAVVGSRVAGEVAFRVAGVLTDPTVIIAYVKSPNGVLTGPVTFPQTNLTNEAVGVYRYEFSADTAGTWAVRFEGSGAVEAAGEQFIQVRPSIVF